MPVWNPDGELIGVTQLVNKKKTTHADESTLSPRADVPDIFQISFDLADQKYMQIFNNQVGVILQNVELLAAVKQQEKNLQNKLNETKLNEAS